MSYTRLAPRGVCAALLLLALLSGCGGGGSSTPVNTGPVTSAPRTANGLQFTLVSDKAVYKANERFQFQLLVKNVGAQPIPLSFYTPPGGADASVSFQGRILWQASALLPGENIGAGLSISNDVLNPGDTLTCPFNWSLSDSTRSATDTQQYTLNAWFTPTEINGITMNVQTEQTIFAATPIQVTIRN